MSADSYSVDPESLAQPDARTQLSGWYANPLDPAAARALESRMRTAEQRCLATNQALLRPRLGMLIAGFWCARSIDNDYRSLHATARGEMRALVDLIYGQLLISCKRTGAWQSLNQGFTAIAPVLGAADYFAVLKRHELLQHLPLSAAGGPPQNLDALLIEAKIIKQIKEKGSRRGTGSTPHNDTLG